MKMRTITLDAALVERLEQLAQGRDLNEVVGELLKISTSLTGVNRALAVVDIEWLDEPDTSTRSFEDFGDYLRQKWLRIQ